MANTVAYRFLGDVAKARSMVGFGNLQLDILKRQMELGGLDQYRRIVSLPDGTSFLCTSVFGISTVNIFVPVTPSIPVEKEEGGIVEEKNIMFAYGSSSKVRIYSGTCQFKKEFSTGLSANVHVESMDDKYLHVIKYGSTTYYKAFDYSGNEKYSTSFPQWLEYAGGWHGYYATVYADSGTSTVTLYDSGTVVSYKTYAYGTYTYYVTAVSLSSRGLFIVVQRTHNTTSVRDHYIEQYDLGFNAVTASTPAVDSIASQVSYRVPHSAVISAYDLTGDRIIRVFNSDLSSYSTFDTGLAVGTTESGNKYFLGIINSNVYYNTRDASLVTRIYKFSSNGDLLKSFTLPDTITGGGAVAQLEETQNV